MDKVIPAKEITLVIKGNNYVVKLPRTGQFIDIQCIKAKITSDNYNSLQGIDYNGDYAKLLVDMIATFNVLIPDLKKDMNVPAILELEMMESRQLLDPYVEFLLPWLNSWMEIISAKKKPEEIKTNV